MIIRSENGAKTKKIQSTIAHLSTVVAAAAVATNTTVDLPLRSDIILRTVIRVVVLVVAMIAMIAIVVTNHPGKNPLENGALPRNNESTNARVRGSTSTKKGAAKEIRKRKEKNRQNEDGPKIMMNPHRPKKRALMCAAA